MIEEFDVDRIRGTDFMSAGDVSPTAFKEAVELRDKEERCVRFLCVHMERFELF